MINLNTQKHVAILASFSGEGGVERMILNLAEGLSEIGCRVDLLCIRKDSPHLRQLPSSINVISLGIRHALQAVYPVARYLKKVGPDGLIAAKDRAGQAAIVARWLSGAKTRLAIRIGTTVSAALEGKSSIQKWFWYLPMRMLYPHADRIIGVSHGVTQDLRMITGLSDKKIVAIPNPVISERIFQLAEEASGVDWLDHPTLPVILGIGRLTRQKDFGTLLRAFAILQQKLPSRLIIVGRGKDEAMIRTLAKDLGMKDRLLLPGWNPNPYAFLRRAKLFVLSSLWEGSPNVLTEAMALGTPCVATDCPSGPSELLTGQLRRFLVPMQEPETMASAMWDALNNPPEPRLLQEQVRPYWIQNSAKLYLNALLSEEFSLK